MKQFSVNTSRIFLIYITLNETEFTFAQLPPIGTSSTVSVTGVAELRKPPEELRLQMNLFATGSAIASARTQLGTIQSFTANQLVNLGDDRGYAESAVFLNL